MKIKILKKLLLIVALSCALFWLFAAVYAAPIGPTATYVKNSTRVVPTNVSLNDSTGGGYINTYNFNGVEQNRRWKAYVGNVTGTLTLDDANSYTIYDWNLGSITGEVYATRNSSSVSWTTVNCSWGITGNYTNKTITNQEDAYLSHTRLDNITSTFSARNHSTFAVGDISIPANQCYSIFPYVNDSAQSTSTFFPEVLLYDGTTIANGKLLYASIIENNQPGYDNQSYDFQMLVPEIGSSSWTSATPYYFYVELV